MLPLSRWEWGRCSAALFEQFVNVADAGERDVKRRRGIVAIGQQVVVFVVEIRE